MKILITGGCGFIGSHVADRFYKEGHEIYIIDNLATGNIKNLEMPHKFYNLDIASKKCEEIFKANRFDVVVNLSAQVDVNTSLESPYLDSRSNLLGITNMLDLSHKYGVKKFIFSSSAAVYGNTEIIPINEEGEVNPISPYGMSKSVGEFYCEKWSEIYGLSTVCLRFSNVYGPKQGLKGDSGVISIFMNNILNNKDIKVYGDGQQTRDFIYVEDLVDGIYKAFEKDASGVFNLSTNTESSINSILSILNSFHTIKTINHLEARAGDIKDSRLDNTKISNVLGWSTKYSFEQGLEKTFKWFSEYYKQEEIVKNVKVKKTKDNKVILKAMPYIENFLLIAIIALINIFVIKDKSSFFKNPMDLSLFYIIIISLIYGTKQAVISIVLSSTLYLYLLLKSGVDIVTIIYEPSNILQILVYIIIGAVIGYAIDYNKTKIYIQKNELDTLNDKYEFLEELYNENRIIKEELHNQIISSKDSFGSIYNVTKALESLEVEEIYAEAIGIVEELMETSEVAIYCLNNTGAYLRLKAKSLKGGFILPYSIKASENKAVAQMLKDKNIFVNRNLDKKFPIMLAPVLDREKVVAFVSIHELKFENLNLYNENVFKTLVNLISSSINKAYVYDEATLKDKHLTGTEILTVNEFNIKLKAKIEANKSFNIDFTLIRCVQNKYTLSQLYYKISTCIRDIDIIGIGSDDNIYIIISNTNFLGCTRVLDKLLKNDIIAEIVEEVQENV